MRHIYQKEIGRLYHTLNKEQQLHLHARVQKGDDDARQSVIHSCLPLVISIAKKFRFNNKHIDLEDFIQEGNMALIRAVDNWDFTKGTITTVATWYIRNAFIDMINDARYTIRTPVTFTRRAAEDLRKIKNVNSSDVSKIAKETSLTEKRIKKLLAVAPRHQSRVSTQCINPDDFLEDGDLPEKPCIADLIELAGSVLEGDQKTIFGYWAGLKNKKMGVKDIADYLGRTQQYVYDNLKAAQRLLKQSAKESKKCPNSM